MSRLFECLTFKCRVANNKITRQQLKNMFEKGELSFLDDKALLFIEYYLEYGSLSGITARDKFKDKDIGQHMSNLRRANKERTINYVDKVFYEALGLNFLIRQKNIDVLEYYCAVNNCYLDCLPANKTIVIDGIKYNILTILDSIKSQRKKGKKIEGVERLNVLRMPWEYNFNKRILPLKLYYEQHGTIANIKYKEKFVVQDENGKTISYNVGTLIVNLRGEYHRNVLTEQQVKKLNKLGMNWSTSKKYKRNSSTDLSEESRETIPPIN